jgi:hypothetical protein
MLTTGVKTGKQTRVALNQLRRDMHHEMIHSRHCKSS